MNMSLGLECRICHHPRRLVTDISSHPRNDAYSRPSSAAPAAPSRLSIPQINHSHLRSTDQIFDTISFRRLLISFALLISIIAIGDMLRCIISQKRKATSKKRVKAFRLVPKVEKRSLMATSTRQISLLRKLFLITLFQLVALTVP